MNERKEQEQKRSGVYKTQDFSSYILWKSLPSFLKGQPRHALEKFGIADEFTLSLFEIKTQTEFAKRFSIKDLGTLTDWNKRIEEEGLLPSSINSWARSLTPNVVFALYRNASKNGRAQEVRAWFELVEHNQ